MPIDLVDAVLAIGSLGTASFGLVDASKALGGGISRCGFAHVQRVHDHLYPAAVVAADAGNPLGLRAMRATLYANWVNGLALADQRAIAKTLVKLRLDPANAAELAAKTGVDPGVLTRIAASYASGASLSAAEQDVAGRFDLLLTTLLDEGYQRADQAYRNGAKIASVAVAILLALGGKWALGDPAIGWGTALLAGILAAPLAPVSKDLASALQASVKTLQLLRK